MEITIYLPDYAIKQLETCDDSSVWARPIPFSDSPSEEFPLSLTYNQEDERFYDPTDSEYLYPDRTEPETVLELLVEVDPSKYVVNAKQRTAPDEYHEPDFDDEEDGKDGLYLDEPIDNSVKKEVTGKKYETTPSEEEEEADKREVVDSATLEEIISRNSDKKIHISGPTMLCTSRIGYEAFFDQEGKLISCIYENDADFRDE